MFKKSEEKIAKKEATRIAKEEKKAEKKLLKQQKDEEKTRKIEEKIKKIDEKLMEKGGYTKEAIEDMWTPDPGKSIREQLKDQSEYEEKKVKLDYLGGHPEIPPGKITLSPSKKENNIVFGNTRVEITSLSWDEKGKRSAGKAAAGAIVGGVLTAGAGAIVGAAIGGRKKDDSLAVMTVKDGVVEYTLYFRCDKKEYPKVVALVK